MNRNFKSLCLLFVFTLSSVLFAQNREDVKNGTILHAWCWSFKTIEENMQSIADAGYTAFQTSPINTCLVGEYGGMELMSEGLDGKWYYHYQPIDWKIGNYQLGTRDEFISMCKKAEELGLAVIVDILPNHTTPRRKDISKDLLDAVGGIENLYHSTDPRGISNYGDRNQVVNFAMGGLPDVNTENPKFQAYFMKFINDVIDCGADGFRVDTARHIALPDDPKDAKSPENNFWPIFTGKKPIGSVMMKNAENLFIYGEVLQGGASREEDYAKFVPVTASNYGSILRSAVKNGILSARGLNDWKNDAGEERIVTWIESHDTYANEGESASIKNFELRAGYALLAARKGGTPLFFNRPQGPEGVQFPGVSKIGDKGNDEYKNPEVVAANKFRTAMKGQPEEMVNGSSMGVLFVKRGGIGVTMINMTNKSEKVSIPLKLVDGVYKDQAHGKKFTLKNGIMTGTLPKKTICVVY